MKYGNLNFLEPSGPFQVCNGTALPLPLDIRVFFQKTFQKIQVLLRSDNNKEYFT
jgi:hypothetical protein